MAGNGTDRLSHKGTNGLRDYVQGGTSCRGAIYHALDSQGGGSLARWGPDLRGSPRLPPSWRGLMPSDQWESDSVRCVVT